MRQVNIRRLSTKQVAQQLGFSDRTIARWCRDGKFPNARKVGRVWRIPEREVDLVN